MKRLLQPFVLVVSGILVLGYTYVAWRLASEGWHRVALALPFALVWVVPVIYWGSEREEESFLGELMHMASYLSMAWLSFLVVLTLARDVVLLIAAWTPGLGHLRAIAIEYGASAVIVGSVLALLIGAVSALRGPRVRQVDIPIEGLDADLNGFRIAQISDLHVGRTIRHRYVARVVKLTQELNPDLVALTGDMVDGSIDRLAPYIAPLRELAQTGSGFFVLGNHDCYSGASAWIAHFRRLGFTILLNSHAMITRGNARVLVGGVLDPTARPGPKPELAAANAAPAALRILLAHNPKIAPAAERAGFDLQVSGHTHAGQFFPWTLAVRLVHAPHVSGLSREGRMWVYVSAGTGTWGPPVRFGTTPELTLIRLVHA